MSLPILNVTAAPTPATLIRYFYQSESKWTEHLSESTALDVGTAWANPNLPRIFDANRMLDASLPPGMSPQEAVEQVKAHFDAVGSPCHQWCMNPSAPAEQTAPLTDHLLSLGYKRHAADIMYLQRLPSSPIAASAETMQIIPSRASFKHARLLFEQFANDIGEPQITEMEMLHLDDPHYDALLAMQNGNPIGHVGVLAIGEIGRIDQVYVAKPFRGRRIGTTLVSRGLEICARSLFKHILLSVLPDNNVAIRLYEGFGFKKIGEIISYFAPGSDTPRKV